MTVSSASKRAAQSCWYWPIQAALAQLAGAHAPCLLGGDQPRLFQHADMLFHARQGHMEFRGKLGDGGVGVAKLLQHAAPCGVGKRSKSDIAGLAILNHMVHYVTRIAPPQGEIFPASSFC